MDLREAALASGQRHPWELARARALARVLATAGLPERPRVLDVGCGDAFTARAILAHAGRATAGLVGVDEGLSPEACDATALASGTRVVSSWDAVTGERFDLLLLLDVLEHVDDDEGFLRRLLDDHLVPGGRVLVTVPAWPALFSDHDRFLAHHRRYRGRDLDTLLRRVGLAPRRHGYLFASLMIPRALAVAMERFFGGAAPRRGLAGWHHGSTLTATLAAVLAHENRMLLALERVGLRLPGLSAWALCDL